jgi:hypothetical protein
MLPKIKRAFIGFPYRYSDLKLNQRKKRKKKERKQVWLYQGNKM